MLSIFISLLGLLINIFVSLVLLLTKPSRGIEILFPLFIFIFDENVLISSDCGLPLIPFNCLVNGDLFTVNQDVIAILAIKK